MGQTNVCPTLAPPDGALFMRRVYRLIVMRDLNVATAQGYWIERQTGNDRPALIGHLQAEQIVSSRLAVVNHSDAELMIPDAVERPLTNEYRRIADNRERLHGSALEFHIVGAAFVVKEFAFWHAVLPVSDVEPEVSGHAIVRDGSAARDESERRIIYREHVAA